MRLSNSKKAVLALICANIIWGAAAPIYKWALLDVPVFTFAFIRFFIPTLLIFIFFRKYIQVSIKKLPLLVVIGLCDISFNIGLYLIALKHTASINAPIIASAGPVFLILLAILFLKEHPTRKMLLGNLIGLTGVLLIVVQPFFQTTKDASIFGNLLIIGSTISAVFGTILAKKARAKIPFLTVMFWSFTTGTLTFLPFFLHDIATVGFLPNLNFQGITGLLYATILSSSLCYVFYYWSIRHIHASETSIFAYIDPVAAILIAAPLLGEFPTPLFIIGSILVFFGIYVAENRIQYHPFHKLFK